MRTLVLRALIGAVGILAIEVLLLWGYFTLVGVGAGLAIVTNRAAAIAFLVGTVSVIVWFGFMWGFRRLVLTVAGCVVLSYGALVLTVFVDLPDAVVCERGRPKPNVALSSPRPHGYFAKTHVLGCTLYVHKSRTPPGITHDGGGWGGGD